MGGSGDDEHTERRLATSAVRRSLGHSRDQESRRPQAIGGG
jgi:hypothetical protein